LLQEKVVTTYKEIANLITANSKSQIDEEVEAAFEKDQQTSNNLIS